MKIILPVPFRNPDGFADVEAELLFDIAPHLANVGTFAVHKEPNSGSFYWNVSNVETGMWVGKHWKRSVAIREATALLKAQTPDTLVRAYENAPKLYPQLAGKL